MCQFSFPKSQNLPHFTKYHYINQLNKQLSITFPAIYLHIPEIYRIFALNLQEISTMKVPTFKTKCTV
ncbi:MAG: hypothetical protein LBJ63_05475, partial [Prevotellaceae bacterium]|nr:hypothetical protein [Prevotellaceae bacterium]